MATRSDDATAPRGTRRTTDAVDVEVVDSELFDASDDDLDLDGDPALDDDVIDADADVIDTRADVLDVDVDVRAEPLAEAPAGTFDEDGLLPLDPVQRVLPNEAFHALVPAWDPAVIGDAQSIYFAQLRHIEPLPAEEQTALARRYYYDGDLWAARRLIVSNLRLVVKIAKEYRRNNTDLMELIQEGNLGLAEAIQRFDPEKGVKFTSYAQYWVRAMILKYIMNVVQLVKVGNTRAGRRLFYNLQRAREELIQQGYLTPTHRQLADHLHVSEKDVQQVSLILDHSPASLDEPRAGYESTTLGETIADHDAIEPGAAVSAYDLQQQIRAAFDAFGATLENPRDLAIWNRRVTADPPASLESLGEEFGVSRERIRQVEVVLKGRFRDFFRQTIGDDETDIVLHD